DLDAPGGHCAAGATPYRTILEWLSETNPVPRIFGAVAGDHDADGIADAVDPDDDNDGALDIVDDLPLEPRDWLDTDADGIGNFEDPDADGDGVKNALDPFPLDSLEWLDNDGDGVGDNIDVDDDNDGVPDIGDPQPKLGLQNDQLTFGRFLGGGFRIRDGYPGSPRRAGFHPAQPAGIIYPEALGDRQSWHFISLGDSDDPVFEIMVDSHENDEQCKQVRLSELCQSRGDGGWGVFHEQRLHRIWIDRNQNRDLTDDGLPLVMADRRLNPQVFSATDESTELGVNVVLNVHYETGERLPYKIALATMDDRASGELRLGYNASSYWIGRVSVPGGEPVLVGTFDANLDALFNSGAYRFEEVFEVERKSYDDGSTGSRIRVKGIRELERLRDFACVDLDRDGELNDCGKLGAFEVENEIRPVYPGESFTFDGRECTLSVGPTGHRVLIDC
ncbi:MAG: hypothetical protein OXG44_17820, partial [Gammaproteobacteria bacterium]|nr:hypothetical protein [Gammaproteobacteria bacterium]